MPTDNNQNTNSNSHLYSPPQANSSADIYRQDLEMLYKCALDQDNLSLAVKIKELIGKTMGIFTHSTKSKSKISLKDMNIKELKDLIEESVNYLK